MMAILCVGFLIGCQSKGTKGPIRISDVWSRPARVIEDDMGGMGVVYLTIENKGRDADRLLGAESAVADAVELHSAAMEGGMATMQALKEGVAIPARGSLELEPGGLHIMLIRLNRHLDEGDSFKVNLLFENAGKIEIESLVAEK